MPYQAIARWSPPHDLGGIMARSIWLWLGLAISGALMPTVASAHTGIGDTGGFAHGFLHPVTGLDHILAMVTVGIFAWQLGGRAIWLVPASFVAIMALGGMLGIAAIGVPLVELAIAVSVIVLGAMVAAGVKAPLAVAMGIVGLFAMFHGHAHGAVMPETAAGVAYGLGFMLATAMLHLAGVGIGFLIGRSGDQYGQVGVRAAGGVVAIAGIGILAGAI